ncbi:probable leucine-rich repeat receptor-like protein kinase [Tanacetum coccineum]
MCVHGDAKLFRLMLNPVSATYVQSQEDGLEIAVERLSKSSSQGVAEFGKQVICTSKLQYQNLVKLLDCNLTQFPFSILGNLTHFELSVNSFFGPIPLEIGLLSKLVYLDFSTNQFSGVIPPTIDKLSQLTILHVFENHLTGPIPQEIGSIVSLERLSLRSLKSLTELNLRENQLNGSIPPTLKNLTSLQFLFLRANKLSGPIPPGIGRLQLFKLQLDTNHLSGQLPDDLCQGGKLQRLAVNHN